MANNLRLLRIAAGLSQPALASRMGTTKNQLIKLEKGDRQLSLDWIEKAAKALGVDPGDIVTEAHEVDVVGFVGAGAEAHYYAEAQGPFDRVPAPDGAADSTVAVEVRGDSLGPLFDRWLVYYDQVRAPVTADLIGRLCVVGMDDGRVLVKQLKKSRTPGLYHLISNQEPPITDVPVTWAARVITMTPR